MHNMANLPSYLVLISLLASCYWISPTLSFEPAMSPTSQPGTRNPAFEPTPETQALIDKICSQMEIYGFCNSVFRDHLPAPYTDAIGLTEVTIHQCLNQAADTIQFIRSLIKNETDKVLVQRYRLCFQAYNVIQSQFTDAYYSFNNRDFAGVDNNEKPTPEAEHRCELVLTTGPVKANPLIENNHKMRRLIAMARVTVSLIGKKA